MGSVVDLYVAAMGFNDILYHTKPQTGSHLLCSKKWIPDLFQNIFGNTLTFIAEIDGYHLAIGTNCNLNYSPIGH